MIERSIRIYGNHDDNTHQQFCEVMEKAEHGVLCADGHLGYVMPIGGVAAYKNKVSPMGVGFDIGCGNCAFKLDMEVGELNLMEVLDFIEETISFGIGQTNPDSPKDHPLFESEKWYAYPKQYREGLRELGRNQLGTVGSGNHYVDIFKDQNDYVWIGVHFGSRGLGHKTATGFLNLSVNGAWDERAKEQEVLLDMGTQLGHEYFAAMELAGEYAKVGREWVCEVIRAFLGAALIQKVHNHHNFTWKETHFGESYFVVRKGATPAFPGQKGFIGGSMGDNAVIIEGVDCEESKSALYSTVHGAGRVMSRSAAKGKGKWKKIDGKRVWTKKSDGLISQEMMHDWLKEKGVQLRGAGLDEAPQAYRRLPDVLKCHGNTIKILHTLTPLGVVMAGENEFDPFKD